MADLDWKYQAALTLRRLPPLHRALKWTRRRALPGLRNLGIESLRRVSPRNPCWGPPRGLFSLRDLIRRGEIEGRIVLEDQGAPRLPDGSLQVRSGLNQHASQPWPILWSRHREARLVGPGLASMNDHKELALESVYHRFHRNEPAYRGARLPPPIRLPGRWTSLVSWWTPNGVLADVSVTGVPTFSHWVMDALPRLALLKEFPADTGILVPPVLARYQQETLKLLGLADRVRPTPERHLVVEDYYFSSPTAMIACYNPYGVAFLRSAFLPKADPEYHGPKRFVIQRKGKSRGIKNEQEVHDFFRGLGWEILDTEKLTFAQEIKLFAEAEAFAGMLGSGFTNGIWSRPGCKVITFVADNWLDGWVEWICDVNALEYRYQVFPSDYAFMTSVDLGEVRKLLRSVGLEAGR